LEKLEQQVRNRGAAADAGDDSGPSDAADSNGYLGVVADDRLEQGKGVRIMEVLKGSPAERSGLAADDLVTSIAGKPVRTMEDFARILGPAPVGARLQFEIKRNRKQQQLEVTLGRRPPQEERPYADFGQIPEEAAAEVQGELRRPGLLGVRVDEVTAEAQAKYDLPSADGALIVHINENSPGERAGLPMSGVIVGVNEKRVSSPADLKRLIASAGAGAEVMLTYYHRGELHERTVRLAGAAVVPPAPLAGPNRMPPMIPFRAPPVSDSEARIEELEQRIGQLEQRLAELEQIIQRSKAGGELPPPERP
jgi:S1-C subfamily serine protease